MWYWISTDTYLGLVSVSKQPCLVLHSLLEKIKMFDDLNKDSVKCNGLFLEIVCRFIDLQSAAALD